MKIQENYQKNVGKNFKTKEEYHQNCPNRFYNYENNGKPIFKKKTHQKCEIFFF